jgi:hypothetical protein
LILFDSYFISIFITKNQNLYSNITHINSSDFKKEETDVPNPNAAAQGNNLNNFFGSVFNINIFVDQKMLIALINKAQNLSLDDQRGKIDSKRLEMPDFLVHSEQVTIYNADQ